MKDIKERASAKAFAKYSLADLELKKIQSESINYADYGSTRENAIAYAEKEVETWSYIVSLIEKDIS
jgi:hypothetical protein